ncbi:unnamed protein product [Dracunculus medinensis]|uniref:Nudix hydrolase domain-containing protein n=1 Tax=Dracunculus medinensis TaxID=318479 RepID=A0A0N4UI20_DRAME|nr:unnamed protein product [Dracunculus medinensis]
MQIFTRILFLHESIARVCIRHCAKKASSSVLDEKLIRSAIRPQIPVRLASLFSYLVKNTIHHEPGKFLILSKPYGVSSLGHKGGNIFKPTRFDRRDENLEETIEVDQNRSVTIESAIPLLAQHFREPNLMFCTGLKRYITGPLIIPANKREYEKIFRSHRRFSSIRHRALVICAGRPISDSGHIQGYATFQKVRDHSEYIFVKDGVAKPRAKSGQFAVSGSMEYKVLASNYGCSLIDIEFPIFNRHLPRLMLTELLSPILGDPIYMQRIVEIDSTPTLIEPKQLYRTKHIKRSFTELEHRLSLKNSDIYTLLPMYFHVYRTIFPSYEIYFEERQDLVAFSLLPCNIFFTWIDYKLIKAHMTAMLRCLNFTTATSRHLKSVAEETADMPLNIADETCFTL